jgi:dipeptidyl aminopeptidase/acylaminoacyl peptidase
MDMAAIVPYGEWPSPISAAEATRAVTELSFPAVRDKEVWWQEARPDDGGRTTIMCAGPDGHSQDLLPAPWDARTTVHEYGGQSYLPVPGGFVFANFADQRLHLAADGASAVQPLTPATGSAHRYADLVLSPDRTEVWCVRERHDGGSVIRSIVAIPLDGSAGADGGAIRELVSGADFFAFPTPSPDGRHLAWICWDHPQMPWDGTRLLVAPIAGGAVGKSKLIMGGPAESVLAPAWRDETSVYAISDSSGWWNLYLATLDGSPRHPLCPREEEFASPLWSLGKRPYAVLGSGQLAVLHGRGDLRLGLLDPGSGTLTDLDPGNRTFATGLSGAGTIIAGMAAGPAEPWSVIRADLSVTPHPLTVLRRAIDPVPDPAYLPSPRLVDVPAAPGGITVPALVYAPSSPVAKAPEGDIPPYIVWVHGGPTSNAVAVLDLEKAFFTSRGIGVIDVNYAGSSGYGRAFRERLRGQWGVVDVADVMSAALALAEAGEVDGARLAIRGGSAGGWTALAAVTSALANRPPVFAAAVSYYGVTDLRTLRASTHDFESRYLDGLVGSLPAASASYDARSPLRHVTARTCPVLLLQGADDPVVPPAQAETFVHDLTEHGIPHAYLKFDGEGHGFRRAGTIVACLEAELSFYGQVMGFDPVGIPPVKLS